MIRPSFNLNLLILLIFQPILEFLFHSIIFYKDFMLFNYLNINKYCKYIQIFKRSIISHSFISLKMLNDQSNISKSLLQQIFFDQYFYNSELNILWIELLISLHF